MFHTDKYKTALVSFLLTGVILVACMGCDSILGDKYKEKDYSAREVDVRAAALLSRDTTWVAPVQTRILSSIVESGLRDSLTDNQIIHVRYNTILDSLSSVQLSRDSLLIVHLNPLQNANNYALLQVSANEAKDIYIYTSLFYEQSNYTEYVDVRLVRSDTSLVQSFESMTGETASTSSKVVQIPGGTAVVPTIHARFKLHVDAGTYLVRFTTSNSISALQNIKVVILSY